MKVRNHVGVWMIGCTLALLASAGPAFASVFTYDFESLNGGGVKLEGQDGWGPFEADVNLFTVNNGPGADTTQCITGGDWQRRTLDAPIVLTSDYRHAVQRFWVDITDASGYAFVGALWSGGNAGRPAFGTHYVGTDTTTLFRSAQGSVQQHGDTLARNQWYEIQLAMDLSTPGGLGTVYYRQVGQSEFTRDHTLFDRPLGLTVDSYTATDIAIRTGGGVWVDNYLFDSGVPGIPEPSTLIMLVIGMTSLLAYAWRKRR
jgi:hypothetical protein